MTDEQMHNHLINYTVDKMTEYLMDDYSLTAADALNLIYNSRTYSLLCETANGLCAQSPLYVFQHLKRECLD